MPYLMEIQDLSFNLGKRKIINKLTLSIEEGQFIGLLGPNGTGKSTLLKLLAKLLKPESGDIFFRHQPLIEMNARAVAKAITYMPQTTLFDYEFTVEQVVLMGRNPHRKRWQMTQKKDLEIATEAMELTGTYKFKDRFMNQLSGGERQLVFLAKAITQQSDLLLLDEPTSDLDIFHQVQICKIIQQLVKEGKTIIAAIHDINLAAHYCDKLLLFNTGEIQSFSAPSEAITTTNLKKVFQTDTFTYDDPYLNKRQMIPYSKEEMDIQKYNCYVK